MTSEAKSKTYRYRTPRMPEWREVVCSTLAEARFIARMEYNQYSSADRRLPNGTIVERAPQSA